MRVTMATFDALLQQALDGNDRICQQVILELSAHPEEMFERMAKGYHSKHTARVLIPALAAIGYPRNALHLPWLVAEVDRNSPAWYELISATGTLGPQVMVSYLVAKMWERKVRDAEWCYDVESICTLLLQLDEAYAVGCGPVVAYLLSLEADPHELDPLFLMDVLEKIGSGSAAYAVPHLLAVLERQPSDDVREQTLKLIASYSAQDLEPYRHILKSTGSPTI
jgi:hypothetical protein